LIHPEVLSNMAREIPANVKMIQTKINKIKAKLIECSAFLPFFTNTRKGNTRQLLLMIQSIPLMKTNQDPPCFVANRHKESVKVDRIQRMMNRMHQLHDWIENDDELDSEDEWILDCLLNGISPRELIDYKYKRIRN
jgi:hypothetical protein